MLDPNMEPTRFRCSIYKPCSQISIAMEQFSRLNLKAMSPVNPEVVCKESMLRLIMEIHDCKASGASNCLQSASESAKKYLEKAIRMDSSAFAFSKCKELASIAEIDPSFK